MELRFAVAECSLGRVLVAATAEGVCAVFLGDATDELVGQLGRQFPQATLLEADKDLDGNMAAIVRLIEEPGRAVDLPLDLQGTEFQKRVWTALTRIPMGETRSYSEVADAIGSPSAARAVARACATNAIAVVIPCHRVVRSGGDTSGYRWGVDRKRRLLSGEAGAKKPPCAKKPCATQ